jgi:membrane protein DedA with SNARE-associated domain
MDKYLESILQFLYSLGPLTAYSLILGVLFICGLGVPIPEDITLIVAGFLSGLGKISLIGALLAGFVGVLIGDGLLFFLGRTYGRNVFQWPLFKKFFSEERVKIAEQKIQQNASIICFTARFLPGLRAPIYLMCGILRVSPFTFFLLDGLAALISVPLWVWLGHFAGQNADFKNIDKALMWAKEAKIYLFSSVFVIVIIYILWKRFKSQK